MIEKIDLRTGGIETRDVLPMAEVPAAKPYPRPRVPRDPDQLLAAAAIVDQALQSLLALGRFDSLRQPPRSLFFDVVRISRGFRERAGLLGTTRLLTASATCAGQLVSEWRGVLSGTELSRPERRYKLVSLAAVSLVIPWLMLRRVSKAPFEQ